jgi:hypothetical protein
MGRRRWALRSGLMEQSGPVRSVLQEFLLGKIKQLVNPYPLEIENTEIRLDLSVTKLIFRN